MSQSEKASSFPLHDVDSQFAKVGSTTMEMSTEKQNGLTDGGGGRRRRRSSSSGDSDLVVLSVVFNKKKQKQNDEVAIAIERLRENGVNCVLFTMNDFRNGNRKPESAIDPFRTNSLSGATPSSQAPSSRNSLGFSSSVKTADPKLVSPVALMPALPSIKSEMSENSNGSTDSSTSSNADIYKSVQKVINSFSPSPSPSPPPLSPQLSTQEAEAANPVKAPSVLEKTSSPSSLHKLLSSSLQEPPDLLCATPVPCEPRDPKGQEETKLQETIICSSSSLGISTPENAPKRRRRRRVRRYYTIRKPPAKKKPTSSSHTKERAKFNGIVPTSSTEVIAATSTDDVKPDYLSSPQKVPLDLVVEKVSQESNEVSSTSNVDSLPEEKPKRCAVGAFLSTEDSVQNPDSSSAAMAVEEIKKVVGRKRKKRGGRRKKTKVIKPKPPPLIRCSAFGETPKTDESNLSRTGDTQTSAPEMPNGENATEKAHANGYDDYDEDDDDDDDDDHIPLASLLERKRAFSPDIIRGVKGIGPKLIYSASNLASETVDSDKSRHIFSQPQVSSAKRSKLEILECVQIDEEISSNVQALSSCKEEDGSPRVNTSVSDILQPIPKRKHRRTRTRFAVRRSKKLKKKPIISPPDPAVPPLSPQIAESEKHEADIYATSIFKEVQKDEEQLGLPSECNATEAASVSKIKEEVPSGSTDDDSVPSVDSGIRSSGTFSSTEEFKLENEESSGGSTTDSGINADDKGFNVPPSDIVASQLEAILADEQLGSNKRADDSLPATPDGMQLRRSNFYSLISDNVRKNLENYLDGRANAKGAVKRRKRTKNSYLLNHGDNYPDDPEAPYRLHMATQVLLKLNRRRAKCKPKEDRGKSLLLYLKLLPKRPPRNGKPASAAPLAEEAKEVTEEPLFSGEWTITRRYICHVCGQIENNFWDMVMHKGEQHPGVVVTHTELTGTVPQSLVRVSPVEPTPVEDGVPPCSKCGSEFSTTGDLHRHIFECAGNASWLETDKVPRKKKSKRRRGFKRRLSNTPKSTPAKVKKPEIPKRRPSEVFKCEFCPREFKTEGWLKNHLVTHSLPVSIPLEKLSLPSRASNNSISSRLFK